MAVRYQIVGGSAAEIVASVEAGVRADALPPGAALPPVRALAVTLGISPTTVAAAYQTLRQRGMVETAGRRGTRVRPRPPIAGPRAGQRLPPPVTGWDLSTGEPDPRLLPPLTDHLRRLDLTSTDTSYATAGVLPELAELARARLAADGVPASGIGLTNGALDGIERLLATALRPGDPVAVEDPGWANLLDLVAALGLRPLPVPVDDDGPTAPALRRALAAGARATIITSRAHNPTGAAVSALRAGALREVLAAFPETLLIEDDHAAELAAVALHPLAGATRSWAFLRSASKPYGPDLRLAVLAGDEATLARVEGRLRSGAGWVSTLLQQLVVSLWRDPAVSALVSQASASYARRRDRLLRELAQRGLPARGRTGINVWVPVPHETRAVTALREAGYAVAPGSLFRQASGAGIRITIGRLDEADLPGLAAAVATAVTGAVAPHGA